MIWKQINIIVSIAPINENSTNKNSSCSYPKNPITVKTKRKIKPIIKSILIPPLKDMNKKGKGEIPPNPL